MSHDSSKRMLALCMAQLRQRVRDDAMIEAMIDSGALTVTVKDEGAFAWRRNQSRHFRSDLRQRIRETDALLARAELALSDEDLVCAYEHSGGQGGDARALLAEIRQRGLID